MPENDAAPVPQVDEAIRAQRLSLLYTENAKIAAIFWDWRHKLMERAFAVLGGVFVAAAWLYHEQNLHAFICIPLFVGSIYNITSYFMDRVNKAILLECYRVGHSLEGELNARGAFSTFWPRPRRLTYSDILRTLYLALALLLFAGGVLIFFLVH